jgi:ureidoglycolate lyase
MFSCFPRNISGINMSVSPTSGEKVFKVEILERHPFTSQTFCPLVGPEEAGGTWFVVLVAPSLPGSVTAGNEDGTTTTIQNPPDLTALRAFKAIAGQAVTYAPGTWHAPMVVLGRRRIDFLVMQFVNGVERDDCQEVLLGEGARSVGVEDLLLGFEYEDNREVKSRL